MQILERVLAKIEEARRQGDRAAWEAEQDHLAALEVKVEKARERSDKTLRTLVTEWDAAVDVADGEWPEQLPDQWGEQGPDLDRRAGLPGRRARADGRGASPTGGGPGPRGAIAQGRE